MTEGPIPAISQKRKFRGILYIDREMCKGCGFCVEFCPNEVLALSSEFNAKGYHPPVVVNPDACTGANLCSTLCPDFAIFARREKTQDNEERAS